MIFWWITGLMLLLAVGVLLLSLLRKQPQLGDDTRAQNIVIARERLAELQAEYNAGNIEQQAFEQTREELEQALLDDVAGQDSTERKAASFAPRLGMLLVVMVVPAVSLGLYKHLGSPQYLEVAGP
ncbi:MAG: c-type cytochrome biogenesis protein CcmI, partial [gamma proteobacterium symbiont of Bathyaustriella thionipta]|nr:c-type cytochrome biogenesis protein CcmI [gamma proteobacterium symbiont of Bathyaustriella thionipta]